MAKRAMTPEDLLKIKYVGDPQLSPDGERVLFGLKTITAKNKYLTQLMVVDLAGQVTQLTQGEASSSAARWLPDGSGIVFLSKRGGETADLCLLTLTGGEARRLTDLPEGSIGAFKVSPDGHRIAFTFRPELPERTKTAVAEREKVGGSTPPFATNEVYHRLDGDGYFGDERYRLYLMEIGDVVVKLDQGVTLICEADASGEYDFDWSPDSTELAVIRNFSAQPALDPPNKQIWRIALDGAASLIPGLPKGEKSSPRWSPNGKEIAFAGDVDTKDPWGVRNTKAYLVSVEGGEPRDLTGHQDFDLEVATLSDTKEAAFGASLEWLADGSGLYAPIGTRGETQLGLIDQNGGVKLLTEGKHSLAIGNSSANEVRLAALWGTPTRLPEVAIIEPELATGRLVPRLLTDFNHDFHAEIAITEPEELVIPTTDGLELHGWVLRPTADHFSGPRPGVLQVHGGPHCQYGWAFFHEFQCQVAAGYVVLYTNPRGSKGYGEAWTAAIRGDWGNKDWEDIQSATKWMQADPQIDNERLAVMGGSYGGYMTNWVIGHTHEFKCAISDRCVSNMVSMAGNSDFPFNRDGYFGGSAWGDLEAIKQLWRQSPIAYFDGVKTPTLLIHSIGDLRCNIEQSEQVFTALQMNGVESRFVRYPESTSHGMSRSGPPDLRLHRLGEILSWLGRFLTP